MGRSDPVIFQKYLSLIEDRDLGDCCHLGASSKNTFINSLNTKSDKFYDLSLDNWNINDSHWNIPDSSFDSIVCTRVAYFCKDVDNFFKECHRILRPGGFIFVDWAIGDHWRFEDFKIGWVKNDEQEWCYNEDNFLWSCVWHDSFSSHPEYLNFSKFVTNFGYTRWKCGDDPVKQAIFKEVPVVYNLESNFSNFTFAVDMMCLWPESPQLYIIVFGSRIQ